MAIRFVLVLLTLLIAPTGVFADPPHVTSATDELRRTLDEVFAVAQSAKFRTLDTGERRSVIRKMTDRLFNWPEVAKRALGPHWAQRSALERRRLADGFASLAERAYTGPVEQMGHRRVPSDAIRYLGEEKSGNDTVVRTVFAYPRELPVDFVMSKRGRQWEVCDVRVDGVSAADNYRAQFERVMATGSFPDVVERMTPKTNSAP